jgi:hypothetical protein
MNMAGLSIVAPATWTFYPFDHFVLGRPNTTFGSLQISTAFRHDLRGDASAADCFSVARQFASRDGMSEPFDAAESSGADFLFGGFSFTVGNDFARVWYRCSQRQLLLGLYQCPKQKTDQAASELQEAEQIMRMTDYATSRI